MEIDLLLMKTGTWLLHCLPGLKWLSLYEIVEEFEKLMTKQVGKFKESPTFKMTQNFQKLLYFSY